MSDFVYERLIVLHSRLRPVQVALMVVNKFNNVQSRTFILTSRDYNITFIDNNIHFLRYQDYTTNTFIYSSFTFKKSTTK